MLFCSILAFAQPANDDCANAIPITLDEGVCDGVFNNGDNTDATSGTDPLASCFVGGVNGVWFSFVAPASGAVDISTDYAGGTNDDTEVAVFDDCAGTSELGCSQDAGIIVEYNSVISGLSCLIPGDTYYVLVSGYYGTEGTFCLSIDTAVPGPAPVNDACVDAIPLTVDAFNCDGETVFNGDNTGATACGEPVGSCFVGGSNGIWYSFVAPPSGNVVVTTDFPSGTNEDTEVAVFDDCLGTTELGCSQDDGITVYYNSVLNLAGLTPGTTYYIEVSGYEGTEGTFCIEVNELIDIGCPPPTGLALSNITTNGVDVSWTSGSSTETTTVEVCPAGIPSGDIACLFIFSATSPHTVTGLVPCTDYDVYVQDYCDDFPTEPIGPESFTTTGPSPDLTPACGETVEYPTCPGTTYAPNENITWTLCATGTDVPSIEFTYVDLVTDWTPGGCMTVTFTSDGSVQETGFAFDFTCVDPCDAPSNLVLVSSGNTVIAPPANICNNTNGFTYYEDPGTGNFVFAINWGTMNAAAKAAATVTVTQAGAMGYTEGGVPGVNGDATWSMERYWDVDLAGTTLVAPVSARFYYDPAEVAAGNAAVMADGRTIVPQGWFKTLSGAYSGTPGTTSPAPGNELVFTTVLYSVENSIDFVEFGGIASFSGGTFASSVSEPVLPLELVSIKGMALSDHNRIEWQTASEVDNEFQIVQRSLDGRTDWKEVERVVGRNTQELQSYSILDFQPWKESYYRLKSIDFNGSTEYSEVINVNRSSFSNLRSLISPNPFSDQLEVILESDSNQNATISIYSLDGKIQYQTTMQIQNSIIRKENLELSALQTGVYVIQIRMGDYIETQRIVKANLH